LKYPAAHEAATGILPGII